MWRKLFDVWVISASIIGAISLAMVGYTHYGPAVAAIGAFSGAALGFFIAQSAEFVIGAIDAMLR